MTEMTIYGRGGQGGVTLAKLIATAYYLQGKDVQAFGVYAAERSGAPLQAYVRIDDHEIVCHNQISKPDHIIVLDRALVGPHMLKGLNPEGWVIINTPDSPGSYQELFAGRKVATIDATGIAVANGLGTRTVPIVNTTLLGAVGNVLSIEFEILSNALQELKFGGGNVTAATQAYQQVMKEQLSGSHVLEVSETRASNTVGLFDSEVGGLPKIKTGSWASRKPERRTLTPPCSEGCPAGNSVRDFVEAAAGEEYDRALAILLETSPLPGVCGRVCPAPCMEACNRSLYDEAVNVREIERYVADHARWPVATQPFRPESVAVVGSGPAGLSAAYHLAKLGYKVTIYESAAELGGVMRSGIPQYRLPSDVLDREINHILRHGVESQTGKRIAREDLITLSYQHEAIFIATGLQELRAMELGSGANGTIIEGIEFLDRSRQRNIGVEGERVVVVGGGNTAMDAARTALRLGARQVRIVYRRTRSEMPAIDEEIEEALEEGIIIDELVSPLKLDVQDQAAILTCQRMVLGEPDASGRPRPVPDSAEDAQFDIACDRVILALGQSADLSIMPEGTEVREGAKLLGLIGAPVFAGGDFATNEGTVSAAIGSGRRAAWHVHLTLTGEDLFPRTTAPAAGPDVVTMHLFDHSAQETAPQVLPAWRRRSFREVRLGFVDEPGHHQAAVEAQRCFSCGVCNSCDRCVAYCPEGILLRQDEGAYVFDYEYCKGCGICASQCPRGVVYMSEL